MVVIDDIAKLIDGYYCILDNESHFINVLQYSPFSGEELQGGFLFEVRQQVGEYLLDDDCKLEIWLSHLREDTPKFDVELIPKDKKYLIENKDWYTSLKCKQRLKHHDGEFCGEMAGCFIEDCYGYNPLPKLACVPIKYCPFCGVRLPPEFDQEDWWEKEFRTFKWYKDHKMGEWADGYVDDHDWSEDDYPLIVEDN